LMQKEKKMKNKNYHLLSERDFQRTIFDGEVSPEEAKYKLAVIAAKLKSQFSTPAIIAELEKPTPK
ncbi:hypothetical protein OE181_25795, partial [Escherichia coli]|uniref:hypothetical protein n=1 Tax=Escherichia coli TaxID=562 RepID=UPI0021F2F0EB